MNVRKACFAIVAVLLLLSQLPAANAYLYGIDVSGHQGNINWTQVKGAKDFALIKASEGYNFSDSYFVANRNGARASGILRGFYHYARPDLGLSGVAEADSYVNIVGTFQPGELAMLDYEPEQSTPGYDNPQAVAWCKAWLDEVYSKTGVKPMMYLYTWLINHYDWSPVINAGYPLNYAYVDYNSDPTTPRPPQWPYAIIKQYDWYNNTCPGLQNYPVDLDSFYGDANAWMALGGCPAAPTITTQPQSQTVCSGTNATFSVAATVTSGSISYQWRQGGVNIGGANSSSYTTNVAGSYDCVVSGRCYSTTSGAATLTVNTPPSITTQPVTKQVAFGVKATFSVVATGTSPAYQWQRNSTNISGAINSTYTTGNPGTYRCIVTNSCGTQTSSSASLVINNATWVTTVAQAKTYPDGTIIGISQGPVVTRSMGSVWYIEDSNRACGLRVIPSPSNVPPEGGVATIYGSLTTIDGERILGGALINNTADTTDLLPLGMTCDSAAKPLAQGLFVRLCGKVTVPPDAYNSFTLNDGSATSFTVMLYGPATPADGSLINIRGVVGQEVYGPVLRVNHATDIW